MFIRGDSGEGTETAWVNFHRVEWSLFNGAQRRVGTYLWVSSIAVEFCFPAAKFWVLTGACIRIEFLDRGLEPFRVDATFAGEFFDGLAPF